MKKQRWHIIHEDDHCMIVDKPAAYLSVPDRYDPDLPNLYHDLLQYRPTIYINHRLDKDTSGLILFSKTEKAYKAFSEMFEFRRIDKRYNAIVHGTPAEEIGLIDLPISAARSGKGMKVNPAGKEALTKYLIVKSWELYSLLEIKLLTGRMHQIRVHLRSIGNPIVCDKLYGDGVPFFLSEIKKKYRAREERPEKPLLERQALHASELHFDHPLTGQSINVTAPIPKDMKAVVFQLDKNLDGFTPPA